jgi:carbon storage regulator
MRRASVLPFFTNFPPTASRLMSSLQFLATTRRPVFSLWVRFPPFSALLHGGGNMLVLSRKLGEKIYIGDQICITVVDIDRGKIRLGIEAPRDVAIYRQELLPGKDTLITETVIETPVSSRRD